MGPIFSLGFVTVAFAVGRGSQRPFAAKRHKMGRGPDRWQGLPGQRIVSFPAGLLSLSLREGFPSHRLLFRRACLGATFRHPPLARRRSASSSSTSTAGGKPSLSAGPYVLHQEVAGNAERCRESDEMDLAGAGLVVVPGRQVKLIDAHGALGKPGDDIEFATQGGDDLAKG